MDSVIIFNKSKHLASILDTLVGNTQHHIKTSQDFTDKVRKITLDADKTIVSYVSTDRSMAVPWAHWCPQKRPTSSLDYLHKTAHSHWFRLVDDTWVKSEQGKWKPSQNI